MRKAVQKASPLSNVYVALVGIAVFFTMVESRQLDWAMFVGGVATLWVLHKVIPGALSRWTATMASWAWRAFWAAAAAAVAAIGRKVMASRTGKSVQEAVEVLRNEGGGELPPPPAPGPTGPRPAPVGAPGAHRKTYIPGYGAYLAPPADMCLN